MNDRVNHFDLCETSLGQIYTPDECSNDFGVIIGLRCLDCGLKVERTLTWELAHRILRRNSKFLRSRCFGSRPWCWRPVMSYDTLGRDAKIAVRTQVSDNWCEILPPPGCEAFARGLTTFRGLSNWWSQLAELYDFKVLMHLCHATSGDRSPAAWTVQDFLGTAFELRVDECFG